VAAVNFEGWKYCKHSSDRTKACPVQTSYVLFVEEGKINHWLFIRLQINLNLVFMSIPYLSSQSSFSSFLFLPTWPEGAVRSLNALALLWAHIDCLYPLQSQSGQSAWGTGCLLYPPGLTFLWEIKEGERESLGVSSSSTPANREPDASVLLPPLPLSGCALKGINSVLKRISLVSCCQIRCAPLPFSVWADLCALR